MQLGFSWKRLSSAEERKRGTEKQNNLLAPGVACRYVRLNLLKRGGCGATGGAGYSIVDLQAHCR